MIGGQASLTATYSGGAVNLAYLMPLPRLSHFHFRSVTLFGLPKDSINEIPIGRG
jgi:hypothetical protein